MHRSGQYTADLLEARASHRQTQARSCWVGKRDWPEPGCLGVGALRRHVASGKLPQQVEVARRPPNLREPCCFPVTIIMTRSFSRFQFIYCRHLLLTTLQAVKCELPLSSVTCCQDVRTCCHLSGAVVSPVVWCSCQVQLSVLVMQETEEFKAC